MTTAITHQPVDALQPQQQQDSTVQLQDLQFSYPGCGKFLKGVSLDLPRGSRTLLLGANGAGKTTLLQLIAGKYMVGRDSIRVLQQSPFFDMVSWQGIGRGLAGPAWSLVFRLGNLQGLTAWCSLNQMHRVLNEGIASCAHWHKNNAAAAASTA